MNYSNLKVFKPLGFANINQEKLYSRNVKCVFIGYLKGVNGYKFSKVELIGSIVFLSRDFSFSATYIEMKCKVLEVK